jgi:adenylate kinase family enzyme
MNKNRIAIVGISGSGKSTVARELSQILGIDVTHNDNIESTVFLNLEVN